MADEREMKGKKKKRCNERGKKYDEERGPESQSANVTVHDIIQYLSNPY